MKNGPSRCCGPFSFSQFNSVDPTDVLSARHADQTLEVRLARVLVEVRQAMGDDLGEVADRGPVPVVSGLVSDEHDGLGTCLPGFLQRAVGVLDLTHRQELGAFRGVPTDSVVGVHKDTDDLLVLLGGGGEVPLRDHLAVVAHRPRVVDHESDRRLGVLDDLVDHLRSTRHRNDDAVTRLERVGPGVGEPVVAVPLAVAANAVPLAELRAPLVVQGLERGLVLELQIQEGHAVVLVGDLREAVAGHDHVGLGLADGLFHQHDAASVRRPEGVDGVVPAAGREAEREDES